MGPALRVTDGREVGLGAGEEFKQALLDITTATGGSSARGRWSHLFGLCADDTITPQAADRLGREAADYQQLCGGGLSAETNLLLQRLAGLRQ